MPSPAKIHWTQRPENKDKLKGVAKKRWGKADNSLLSEWEALKLRVDSRLKEIDETIRKLSEERDAIAKLIDN